LAQLAFGLSGGALAGVAMIAVAGTVMIRRRQIQNRAIKASLLNID
jgi:hypothetical protein